jgi:Fe-S-cluster containining protein
MNDTTSCIRCGQCCIKGGPALHNDDIALIHNNILRPDTLFTIRKGEPVYHPVEARLIPAPIELIKIKGVTGSWACAFFDPADMMCGIYEDRPLECRIFKCWDTKDSISLFMQDALSRKAIIQEGGVLEEMISAYEDRFPVPAFMALLEDAIMHAGNVSGEISKIIDMDSSFRGKFIECLGAGEAEMDFLFGRPLKAIVSAMGVSVI